jgi:hypothetical protein
LPLGSLPPVIVGYNASTVPILQLSLSGNGLTEPQLNDLALNFLRTQLVTVPGAAVPFPYGGKTRQVMVNLNPLRMQVKGLSPSDVRTALGHELLERRSWFFICLRRLWTLSSLQVGTADSGENGSIDPRMRPTSMGRRAIEYMVREDDVERFRSRACRTI